MKKCCTGGLKTDDAGKAEHFSSLNRAIDNFAENRRYLRWQSNCLLGKGNTFGFINIRFTSRSEL